MAGKSRVVMHLQNVYGEGCAQNVKVALEMIEGVKAVRVIKDEMVAEVLYEDPATPYAMCEQLLLGGYLSESKEGA